MSNFDFNPVMQCSKLKSIVINENHSECVAVCAKNSHGETNRAQAQPSDYKPRESFGSGHADRDLINNSNTSNNSNSSSRLMMAQFDANADEGVTRININHFNSSNHVFDKIKEVNQRAKKLEEQRQHSLKEIQQTNSKSNLHSIFNVATNRIDNNAPNNNTNYLHQTEMVTFASSSKKDNSTSPIRILKSKYNDDECDSEVNEKLNHEPIAEHVASKSTKGKQTQTVCAKSAHDNFGFDKRFDDASAEESKKVTKKKKLEKSKMIVVNVSPKQNNHEIIQMEAVNQSQQRKERSVEKPQSTQNQATTNHNESNNDSRNSYGSFQSRQEKLKALLFAEEAKNDVGHEMPNQVADQQSLQMPSSAASLKASRRNSSHLEINLQKTIQNHNEPEEISNSVVKTYHHGEEGNENRFVAEDLPEPPRFPQSLIISSNDEITTGLMNNSRQSGRLKRIQYSEEDEADEIIKIVREEEEKDKQLRDQDSLQQVLILNENYRMNSNDRVPEKAKLNAIAETDSEEVEENGVNNDEDKIENMSDKKPCVLQTFYNGKSTWTHATSLDEIELIDDEFDKEIQKSKEDEVDLLANQKPTLAKEKKKKNLQVKIKLPESIPKLPPKKERTLQKCCLVFFLLLLFIIATGILIYFFVWGFIGKKIQ